MSSNLRLELREILLNDLEECAPFPCSALESLWDWVVETWGGASPYVNWTGDSEIMQDISFRLCLFCVRDGWDPHDALSVVQRTKERLQLLYQGAFVQIPSPNKKAERDEAIYEEYNGHNVKELAMKFRVSWPTIFRVVHRERQRRCKTRSTEVVNGQS